MVGRRQRILTEVVLFGLVSVISIHAQQPGASAPGTQIFTACASCHGADGRGGEKAPNIVTVPRVQQLADAQLAGIIHNGISGAGMPAFSYLKPQQIQDVVAYLRILQGRGKIIKLPGNPDHGQALFFGKSQCSQCHMVNGKGGFLGANLSFYGADNPEEQMRAIISDPQNNLPPEKKGTTVVTSTGESITGMLRVSNNFTLTLQTTDGRFHFLSRSDLRKIDIGNHSLMPPSTDLTPQEMDDLVSYLLRAGDENAKRTPTHPAKDDDDDDN